MEWADERTCTLGKEKFYCCLDLADMYRELPEGSHLVGKNRHMLETMQARLSGLRGGNIVELGIFRGGSTVWLHEALRPKKLVALEYRRQPVPSLEAYIDRASARETLRPRYGVNQKQTRWIRNICREEFGDEPLDVVVDDASHLLEATGASFNALFPRLRPGGVFVLEDWGWAHALYGPDKPFPARMLGKPPLTTLVMAALMVSARLDGIVDNLFIDGYTTYICRGSAELPLEGFDIADFVCLPPGLAFEGGFAARDSSPTSRSNDTAQVEGPP